MKKTILNIIVLLTVFAGCKKDPLDITPDGRLTMEDVWKDETRTEAYLNNVYRSIPTYFHTYGYFELMSGATDETRYREGVMRVWGTGSLNPSNNVLIPFYNTYWTGIREANIFLGNIDRANVPNPVKRERFKAEAKALRAFYYWELVKEYGSMPVIDKELDVNFDFTLLKRPGMDENIAFIVKDLDEAIASTNFPLRLTNENERGRFTKAVAHAIKSQALLYSASALWNPENKAEKWIAASKAAKAALDALTANDEYELAPDYGDYFLNRSDINVSPRDRETIYETGRGSRPHLITMNNIPSKVGVDREGACPTQELVDSYDMQATGEPAILGYSDADHLQPILNPASGYDPAKPYVGRDPRFYATVWYNGASYNHIKDNIHIVETFIGGKDQLVKTDIKGNTITGYYLRKFIDPKLQPTQNTEAAWKKYRLGELYLNYAEAENEVLGATNEVYKAIAKVRTRVQMPDFPDGLTKEQMRLRIRNERRVELAIEEHRFWDVRRWKILSTTDKVVTGMEITKADNNTFNYKRFVSERRSAWADKYLIFPLPIGETAIITDFNLNQNPGW